MPSSAAVFIRRTFIIADMPAASPPVITSLITSRRRANFQILGYCDGNRRLRVARKGVSAHSTSTSV
jgi:hypothetical protein